MTDLAKQLEDGRAARRERAKERAHRDALASALASGHPFEQSTATENVCGWCGAHRDYHRADAPPTPPPPKVDRRRGKRYTLKAVQRLHRQLDVACADATGDGYDTEDPSVYYDLARSVEHSAWSDGEHPETIKDFLRGVGLVWDNDFRPYDTRS